MAGFSQAGNVSLGHVPWCSGEFLAKTQHGKTLVGEPGRFVVGFDRRGEVIVSKEPTQTAPMMGQSIVTIVDL